MKRGKIAGKGEGASEMATHAAANVVAFEDRIEVGQDEVTAVRLRGDSSAFDWCEMPFDFSLIRHGALQDQQIRVAPKLDNPAAVVCIP